MKVFKKTLAAVASAIVMASSICSGGYQPLIGNPNTVSAANSSAYLSYEKVDEDYDGTYDCIRITLCGRSAVSVEIPSEIDGLPVTSIGDIAFRNCTSLTSVVIPDSVTYIGGDALTSCTDLTSITIKNLECEIYNYPDTICNGYDENWEPYFNGTIYGYENSTAQAYAEKWGYTFKEIGSEPPVTTTPTLIGDISGSGKIDLSDAIIIAQFILGKRTFTDEERVIADINKDGEINLLDAIEIASYILQDMKK